MLFALDWIKETWNALISAIQAFTEGLNLFSASAAINDFWPLLIACFIAGIVLCLFGFRYHKFVHGMVGGALFGVFGWNIGQIINAEQISISAVYAVILAIVGFFVLYLCYFLNVFAGSYFLFLAVLAPFRVSLQGYVLLIAVLLAGVYCALYIKYKLTMSAVTGAVILGLVIFCHSPVVSAVVFCGCIAGGIYVQFILRRRYERQKILSMQEQLEKYPYGPGLAYGWPDPTLSHASEKKG